MAATLTATPQPTTHPPSVRLDVTISPPAATSVRIERYLPDGTIGQVRTPDGGPVRLAAAQPWAQVVDSEVPYGQPVTYRLVDGTGDYVLIDGAYVPASFYGRDLPSGTLTYEMMPDGTYAPAGYFDSELDISDTVTVPETRPWLITPGRPDLSMPIDLRTGSFETRRRATSRGVLWPIGREHPIVVSGQVRRSSESSLVVGTSTDVDLERLDAILAADRVLMLNVPPQLGLRVRTSYISVGDIEEVRPSDIGADPHRDWRLPYQVTTAPVSVRGRVVPIPGGGGGGNPSGRRWADLALEHTTWQQARATYDTWADAAAGPGA